MRILPWAEWQQARTVFARNGRECDRKEEMCPIGSIRKAVLLALVSLNSDVFVQHYEQFSGKKAERVA
jgi:hypothetical protein